MYFSEYLHVLTEYAMSEIRHGDYVTLSRSCEGAMEYEEILTFSGIVLQRRRILHASDAAARKSQIHLREIDEESPCGTSS